ncbi:MAG: hypothetical protein AAF611_15390 [Bacteroidota bacterium]
MRTYLCMMFLLSVIFVEDKNCNLTLPEQIINLQDDSVTQRATPIITRLKKVLESDMGNYQFSDICEEAYYSFFKNKIGILRASHIGYLDNQMRSMSNGFPLIIRDFTYTTKKTKQDVICHLYKLRGSKNLAKVTLQYDFQQNERLKFDVRRSSDDDNSASLNLAIHSQTSCLDLDINNTDLFNLKTRVIKLIPDYEHYHSGIYGVVDLSVTNNFLVEVGNRFNYIHKDSQKFYRSSFWESHNYDELFPDIVIEELSNRILTNPKSRFSNASATLGTRYIFNDTYELFVNYSLVSHAPNPSGVVSEGFHHSASRIELVDIHFDSEMALKMSITLHKNNLFVNQSTSKYKYSILG